MAGEDQSNNFQTVHLTLINETVTMLKFGTEVEEKIIKGKTSTTTLSGMAATGATTPCRQAETARMFQFMRPHVR